MTRIDWREVICKIKKERRLPKKNIAYRVGVTSDTLGRWQRGETEPKHSQGEFLLELAGLVDNPDG